MSDSNKQDKSAEPDSVKTPLNLNDLASNPMRVGMARLGKPEHSQSKQPKKHWWSRKKR
ncbi:hypothetical protein [Secundilactobacillus yichangensis]|uniref:hypothetical protein n=1 Tax=Secundilactobacillus yichangensis TaxID=2799580 RepID=UPI00194417E0|nr:hypothetical protein [Secundilactobacillus yichangensis]